MIHDLFLTSKAFRKSYLKHMHEAQLHYGPKQSAGGVVVNNQGKILLREPTNHFGGYVWTFPKGGIDHKEEVMDAAVREVKEETGVTARVWKRLGTFPGSTTDTIMFLMRFVSAVKETDFETKQVKWASPQEAVSMVAETTNRIGRKRDLLILKKAFTAHPLLTDPKAIRMVTNLLSNRIIE